jgi:hypothetical protein
MSFLAGRFVCLIAFAFMPAAFAQRYAPVFENYRLSHDRGAFMRQMEAAEKDGIDIRVEVQFLVNSLSSGTDPLIQERAESCLFILLNRELNNLDPAVGEVFRAAIPVFESHLNEAELDRNSRWATSLVSLTAFAGLQPSSRALRLMYRMVDDKDERTQGLALLGLARLKPLPSEAKQILISRLVKAPDKMSGPDVLGILTYALDDPDVQTILLESASSDDPKAQWAVVNMLYTLGPPPPRALDILRRFEERQDLGKDLAETVKAAIARLENKAPPQDEE